jgi:glycosyltransferase involved in cell wall biosynthesis
LNVPAEPLVTVCIPCYNGERFIAQTLQSVINQSLKSIEIVVIDDASTDRTFSVLRGFSDPRMRVSRNDQNVGMGGNWNRAMSYSRGKYVKLLCEDDLLDPQCLERQVGILENPSHRQAVLTVCNRNIINHRNEVVLKRRHWVSSGIFCGPDLIRRSIRMGTNLIGEPVVGLFRKSAIKDQEIVDSSNPFLSDMSLWAELLRAGDAFVDPECLASFRISENAATANIGLRQATCFRAFAAKLHRDPFYRIGWMDLISGYLLSFPLCLLRNAFIKLRAGSISSSSSQPPRPSGLQASTMNHSLGAAQGRTNSECGPRVGRHRSVVTCV